MNDLKFAFRQLLKNPGFTAVAVFTHALGVTGTEVQELHSRIVAFDNLPGARDVYGFHAGHDFAALVGNERRGLSHEFASLATDRVHLPMVSRRHQLLERGGRRCRGAVLSVPFAGGTDG